MYFQYGNYRHADNEVALTAVQQRPLYSQRGDLLQVRKTISLQGVLLGTSQTEIQQQIAALEAAYSQNNLDAGLYHDNGATSPHFLESSQSIDGVKVISLDFPTSEGRAEYATGRTYTITLQADFLVVNTSLVAFQESVRLIGAGGPKHVFVPTINGLPQKQTVHANTSSQVIQSGSSIGLVSYPAIPSPIFPSAEHTDRREIHYGPPQSRGNSFINWPVRWTYHFESVLPIFAQPTRR
jgi:hypothetical protein